MRCKLCLKEKKLEQKSHIIPKMFFKKLKSQVGNKLYKFGYENKIVQDGIKTTFLCNNCEKLFENYETYFSQQILYKSVYHKTNLDINKIKYFILSVAWRCLVFSVESKHITSEERQTYLIEDVQEKWRRTLLNSDHGTLSSEQFFFIPMPCEALANYSICEFEQIYYNFPIFDSGEESCIVAFCLVVPQLILMASIQGKESNYLKYELTDENNTDVEEVPLVVHQCLRNMSNTFYKRQTK